MVCCSILRSGATSDLQEMWESFSNTIYHKSRLSGRLPATPWTALPFADLWHVPRPTLQKIKLSSVSPSITPHLCQTVHINPQTQAWGEALTLQIWNNGSRIPAARVPGLSILWLGKALSWFGGGDPFILQVDNSLTMIIHCDLCRAASSADPCW